MLRVILKLIVMQPQLLLTHAQNYAALMSEGLQRALTAWRVRMLLLALSVTCTGLAGFSAIVAVLLWAALPMLNPVHSWILLVLPAGLFALGALFYWAAKHHEVESLFEEIHEQINLDLLAICQSNPK